MCRVPIHYFRVVQPHSSNLLEPLQCRESKVCRGLSHEFGVIRLYRTFSNRLFTGGTGCVGYLCYFRVVQPQRTSSNLFEPFQCRESKVCRGLSHEFGVVRLYRTFSNCIFTGGTRYVGTYTLVPGDSTAVNLLEPSRTTSVQRKQGV